MKRTIDIVVSLLGLVALLPIFLIIALVVTITSSGGPFFRQTRVGRGRRPFQLIKFRTMHVRAGSEDGSFDVGDGSRVTTVGRFLRKTKLDELPQLWNVLVGDMSLVGPRPEVTKWTEVYPERWEIALSVRPGITDMGSIEFRNEEKILEDSNDPEACYRNVILPRKLELAEQYVRSNSITGDLSILARTIWSISSTSGQ